MYGIYIYLYASTFTTKKTTKWRWIYHTWNLWDIVELVFLSKKAAPFFVAATLPKHFGSGDRHQFSHWCNIPFLLVICFFHFGFLLIGTYAVPVSTGWVYDWRLFELSWWMHLKKDGWFLKVWDLRRFPTPRTVRFETSHVHFVGGVSCSSSLSTILWDRHCTKGITV